MTGSCGEQARRNWHVRDVSKVYRNGATSVTAVSHASLEVRSGEVILILGPSGSGKTTLLSIMGCLLQPTHGEVFVGGGAEVDQLSDGELSRLRREQIGFVFQSFNLLSFLTVRKNVEVALNLAGVRGRQARERATEVLCIYPTAHSRTRLFSAPLDVIVDTRL